MIEERKYLPRPKRFIFTHDLLSESDCNDEMCPFMHMSKDETDKFKRVFLKHIEITGMKLKDVAHALSVSRSYITRIKEGHIPSKKFIHAFAVLVNAHLYQLLECAYLDKTKRYREEMKRIFFSPNEEL